MKVCAPFCVAPRWVDQGEPFGLGSGHVGRHVELAGRPGQFFFLLLSLDVPGSRWWSDPEIRAGAASWVLLVFLFVRGELMLAR